MLLQSGDVNLLKSAKIADALGDGGAPTGAQIAQGASDRIIGKQEECGVFCEVKKPLAGPEEKPPRGEVRGAGARGCRRGWTFSCATPPHPSSKLSRKLAHPRIYE